jgi:hypothetical protein
MPDYLIDPELRIRASPEVVLRRTTEAVEFIRKMTSSHSGREWQDMLQRFEAIRDEWSAIEAVVNLELLLEAKGLLIEEQPSLPAPPPVQIDPTVPRSRFAR